MMRVTSHGIISYVTVFFLAATLAGCGSKSEEEGGVPAAGEATVGPGRVVGIEYTVRDQEGVQVDSNVGGEPRYFHVGAQEVLPALEDALRGLKAGDTTTVTLPPEMAYGPLTPIARQRVELEILPVESRGVGALVIAEDPAGNRRQGRVTEVSEDSATIDLNHPFAGMTLTFSVRILDVK